MFNAIVKIEAVERTEGLMVGSWDVVVTYQNGFTTIFGTCRKESGAVAKLTQHAKRFGVPKINKYLAQKEG